MRRHAGGRDRQDRQDCAPAPAPTQERTLDEDEAAEAYTLLGELERAWRERDCHTVRALTAGAERTLGGRACDAAGKGRPAPGSTPPRTRCSCSRPRRPPTSGSPP
ncbi:hypothetical protein [Thermocatellispora tengchongensis]|uniref:hypothetical protein n=1 Tax=Thermocatellispora tengchongensis TaxID=1073253 RepID=UPI003631B5DA